MTQSQTAYNEYLAAMRDLDGVRAEQERALAAQQGHVQGLHSHLDGLTQRLHTQRAQLEQLAHQCQLPQPPTQSNPAPLPNDVNAAVASAAEDVESADTHYQDARYLAHRAKFLPRWRADERNGLIYGLYAVVALGLQVMFLAWAAGTEKLTDLIDEAVICIALPFVAFLAGWLTIGVVGNPILGEGTLTPSGKLQRNPRLGLAICLSTWLVSCWLANKYLSL
ncbi:MAG TPA: hypothetical protein H9902_14295 [Candidatus Stackebrandtia faecavium]|nr:hypothetical protein [Candidatus Stackebrandtia faecavium]